MSKNEDQKSSQEASQESSKESKEEVRVKKPKLLLDPNTGKPLRNQNPGVSDSPWVGKHTARDTEDPVYARKMREEQENQLKADLGEE